MGTYRRGNTKKWYVDVRDGKGRRIRKSVGASKKVARLVEKDLQVKIAKKEYLGIFEENAIDFAQYAKEWLERKKVTASRSTWRDYRSIMDVYAVPHFGKIPLCDVDRRDVELFLDKLAGLSAKRKNNVMVPLKCLFNDARKRGDLKDSPCETIPRFKEEKPFIDPLSFPEMKAFLASVEKESAAYFATAFLTGMRPNELIALKWGNVDFELRIVTVREGRVQGIEGAPKNLSSYRDIDMLDPLFAVLREHRRESPPDARYVFFGRKGKPLDVHNVRNRIWYPTLLKAGLRKRTMYQTWHTFASLMLSYGEDPLWVARMLGHTSTEMLYRHYGKFIRNRMRRDGMRFLRGFQETEVASALPPTPEIEKTGDAAAAVTANAVEAYRSLSKDFGHSLDTGGVSSAKKGVRRTVTP